MTSLGLLLSKVVIFSTIGSLISVDNVLTLQWLLKLIFSVLSNYNVS